MYTNFVTLPQVDASSEGSSSRPCTPADIEEDGGAIEGELPGAEGKRRKTDRAIKEEDPGAKVQSVITQRWKSRNLGVWSSRNPENQAVKKSKFIVVIVNTGNRYNTTL